MKREYAFAALVAASLATGAHATSPIRPETLSGTLKISGSSATIAGRTIVIESALLAGLQELDGDAQIVRVVVDDQDARRTHRCLRGAPSPGSTAVSKPFDGPGDRCAPWAFLP